MDGRSSQSLLLSISDFRIKKKKSKSQKSPWVPWTPPSCQERQLAAAIPPAWADSSHPAPQGLPQAADSDLDAPAGPAAPSPCRRGFLPAAAQSSPTYHPQASGSPPCTPTPPPSHTHGSAPRLQPAATPASPLPRHAPNTAPSHISTCSTLPRAAFFPRPGNTGRQGPLGQTTLLTLAPYLRLGWSPCSCDSKCQQGCRRWAKGGRNQHGVSAPSLGRAKCCSHSESTRWKTVSLCQVTRAVAHTD